MKRAMDEIEACGPADAEEEVALRVKWGSVTYAVELSPESTVADLKDRLFELTEVLPKRQKVIGLPGVSGRPACDSLLLSNLRIKQDQKVMLIGSREADISSVNALCAATAFSDVVNDLDIDYSEDDARTGANIIRHKEAYRRRLERRVETTDFRIMNAPREGKRLLVLDIDYTIFDCKSTAESISVLSRPGLHQFLASAYRHFDIVVWSQTSWRWLEAKLTELSMLFSTEYKLAFVLDRTAMFSVTSTRRGVERTHEVKALEIIWRKFPQWNQHNTLHVDDLSRNFALNPRQGLKIKAFKNAPISRQFDRELFHMERYLTLIAEREQDFTRLDHNLWKEYCASHVGQPARLAANEDTSPSPPSAPEDQ